jgi:hypothetical protein
MDVVGLCGGSKIVIRNYPVGLSFTDAYQEVNSSFRRRKERSIQIVRPGASLAKAPAEFGGIDP